MQHRCVWTNITEASQISLTQNRHTTGMCEQALIGKKNDTFYIIYFKEQGNKNEIYI